MRESPLRGAPHLRSLCRFPFRLRFVTCLAQCLEVGECPVTEGVRGATVDFPERDRMVGLPWGRNELHFLVGAIGHIGQPRAARDAPTPPSPLGASIDTASRTNAPVALAERHLCGARIVCDPVLSHTGGATPPPARRLDLGAAPNTVAFRDRHRATGRHSTIHGPATPDRAARGRRTDTPSRRAPRPPCAAPCGRAEAFCR